MVKNNSNIIPVNMGEQYDMSFGESRVTALIKHLCYNPVTLTPNVVSVLIILDDIRIKLEIKQR